MSKEGSKSVYPATLLEESANAPQQQPLLTTTAAAATAGPAQPPTYQQATEETAPTPTVVVVNEPAPIYGPDPVDVQCPFCHNFCRTRIRHEPNTHTHFIALTLCLLQFYCCICLPYCIGNCMNVNHYCGMCDRFLGTYKR